MKGWLHVWDGSHFQRNIYEWKFGEISTTEHAQILEFIGAHRDWKLNYPKQALKTTKQFHSHVIHKHTIKYLQNCFMYEKRFFSFFILNRLLKNCSLLIVSWSLMSSILFYRLLSYTHICHRVCVCVCFVIIEHLN